VRVEEQTRRSFAGQSDSVIVTTAHSFKGYESEIVAVPGADKFVANDSRSRDGQRVLPESLYVAMTRARSVLYVSATTETGGCGGAGRLAIEALQSCAEDLHRPPDVSACSPLEENLELLSRVGESHRGWLAKISSRFDVQTAPVLGPDGSIVAEPLLTFRSLVGTYACFPSPPSTAVKEQLEDLGVRAIAPGDDVD
jgi:UvrD-like helicase C-terminal domain